MRVRLNGWQRLWIIISILYLLPVVGITIMFWPSPETTWHRDEFITRMPAELRGKVEGAYATKYQREEARRKTVIRAGELERNYQASLQKESKSKDRTTYRITAPDGHTYEIEGPAGASQEQVLAAVLRQNPSARILFDPIESPNGALIDVHGAVTKKDMERVATAYWAVVESETRAERWQRSWQMALAWIIPCLTLYALGWAIAWVRRGFRSEDPGEPKGK